MSIVIGTSTRRLGWRVLPETVSVPSPSPAYHSLCLGVTGAGKSRLLAATFLQRHLAGGAVGLIDPHGDLSLHILARLAERGDLDDPRHRDRLVYLPFSGDDVPPFNVLAQPHLTAHDIALSTLDALGRVWPDLEDAPLLRTLFLSAALTLIAAQLPLTELPTLLLDAAARERALACVDDPLVHQTFAHYEATSRGRPAMAGSTLRRLFLLSFSPVLRTALGQTANAFDIRRRMDEGTSVIVNLGGVGDPVTRRLLGALLLAQIEQAALSRASVPEHARTPWLCLVDEWPVVASRHPGTLASILDQARKYGLALWLVGQHAGHFGSARLSGALENCRLRLLFRLGADSARMMVRHLSVTPPPGESPAQARAALAQLLQSLPSQHALFALGAHSPVLVRTLDVPDPACPAARFDAALVDYRRGLLRVPSDHLLPTHAPPFGRLGGSHDLTDSDIDTDDWSTPAPEEGIPSYGARHRDR